MNLRTSSRRYHWDTKQYARNVRAEQIARVFSYDEQFDRNRIAAMIGEMPSARGNSWYSYIEHRLNMMNAGIETYTVRSYARLQLDKHIEWHRTISKLVAKLVNHKAAIVFIGAGGSTPANSIIRIKKYTRCPGTRKLIAAFKQRTDCVIQMVDEWMTSQHCARCFKQFDRRTKSHRFKKCVNCVPNAIVQLPRVIVTNVSKRIMQMKKAIISVWRDMSEFGDAIATALIQRRNTERLVSKKQCFWKIWQPAAGNVDEEEPAREQTPLTTVWHRDIAAAKLILYKGTYY